MLRLGPPSPRRAVCIYFSLRAPCPSPVPSSSPPARTPAGPHLSPQLRLGCSGHPAGLGSARRGGKEPSGCQSLPTGDARPDLCWPRGHRSAQHPGRRAGVGSHSSSSLKLRHWQIHRPTLDSRGSAGERGTGLCGDAGDPSHNAVTLTLPGDDADSQPSSSRRQELRLQRPLHLSASKFRTAGREDFTWGRASAGKTAALCT